MFFSEYTVAEGCMLQYHSCFLSLGKRFKILGHPAFLAWTRFASWNILCRYISGLQVLQKYFGNIQSQDNASLSTALGVAAAAGVGVVAFSEVKSRILLKPLMFSLCKPFLK